MMYFMGFDLYFFATYRHIPRKKKEHYDLRVQI